MRPAYLKRDFNMIGGKNAVPLCRIGIASKLCSRRGRLWSTPSIEAHKRHFSLAPFRRSTTLRTPVRPQSLSKTLEGTTQTIAAPRRTIFIQNQATPNPDVRVFSSRAEATALIMMSIGFEIFAQFPNTSSKFPHYIRRIHNTTLDISPTLHILTRGEASCD